MSDDVNSYCRQCTTCQATKLPTPTPAPLANILLGHLWQIVAIDVLEVPMSYRQNRYLLVIQDYFTIWPHAIPMPNQTAAIIIAELVKVFSMFRLPDILHSNQGHKFESALLRESLHSFDVKKSRMTAYHPQGNGMVERFNWSLLQMLRVYVQDQADWERYLPLVLLAYHTAVHSSTRFSPFELMFGRPALTSPLPSLTTFDVNTYHFQLCSTLAGLQDIVEMYITKAAHHQKTQYDHHVHERSFKVGDSVWLSIPTAGKLEPRWQGGWEIKSIRGQNSYENGDGTVSRTVFINQLQRRVQPHSEHTRPYQPPSKAWHNVSVATFC